MSILKHFLRSFIDWIFRPSSFNKTIIIIGFTLLIIPTGKGFSFYVSFPLDHWFLNFNFGLTENISNILVWILTIVGLGLILFGIYFEYTQKQDEKLRYSRKKVLVIETRGLRNINGKPLTESIPNKYEGHRDHILVDLRQGIKDGEILVPNAVIDQLVSLPNDISRRVNGLDHRDITIVYGGLAPVPLNFLIGVMIDDEGPVQILDWDRHISDWKELNSEDDGNRFSIIGLQDVTSSKSEVALVVSVSYQIRVDDIRSQFNNLPIIELRLEDGSTDCHWSEKKQVKLGQQFLDTIISLSNLGVSDIHLFLAAPNSIAFRFGRLYDKRNLPRISVYQFQRNRNPPYPWSIQMPVSGIDNPDIISF